MSTLAAILPRLTLSVAETPKFHTESTPRHGGYVNVYVDVALDGARIGTACEGFWIYTDAGPATGISGDVYDECQSTGWAARAYAGHDRNWQHAAGAAPIESILDDEDDAEESILDYAADYAADHVDYDVLFAAALRADIERLFEAAIKGAVLPADIPAMLAMIAAIEE